MLKSYYALTKPGIIRGNAITAIGGFFFASRGMLDLGLLLAMLVGLSLIIASSCVINNFTDRHIDKQMSRTKNRALVSGEIPGRNALIYAAALGIIGSLILGLFINLLTLIAALFGMFAYVVLYGIGKRLTVHGTLIGSISGSIPPVVGYTAVTNQLDITALLLFIILVFWQMPHFYAIAIYRMRDYTAAKIPVLPVVNGVKATKNQIVAYIIGFVVVTQALTLFGGASYTYAVIMLFAGLAWLWLALRGFQAKDDIRWAKSIFGYSLVVILIFSITISLDTLLP